MINAERNDVTFDTRVPMIHIANVPGHYTAKVAVKLSNGGVADFYLEYENADDQWIASNACALNMGLDLLSGYAERVVTPNSDALSFALRVNDKQTDATANVAVTVMGSHEEGIITIPSGVPEGSTFSRFDDGYNDNGWTHEVGRLQKYEEIFSIPIDSAT
jgi:hypothetical protein